MVSRTNILNVSKKVLIAKNAKICTTLLSQSVGLMFRRKIIPLLFILSYPRRITIHSFLMLKTIDVIFLDENKKVVETTTLKPWTWHATKERVKYVIEAQQETIHLTKTRKGDEIAF